MKPVCQLDEHDAHILGHGHQHLSETGRLVVAVVLDEGCPVLFLGALLVYSPKLCDGVHEPGHFSTEPLLQLLKADAAVLHDIVKKRSGQGGGIQV